MLGIAVLIACLVAAAAVAAYEFSEARRWREIASEARQENDRYNQAQQHLEDRFRSLASEVLQQNSQMLLDRSRDHFEHAVAPVSESLRRFEQQVQAIEKSRVGAYESISAQVSALTNLQERVRESTEQLKTALRSPVQRGRWGEMQLRRVVELAGMLEYCDFSEQKTLFGDTNQRPDLIVRLPNECQVVVDAKVSLEAYLRAAEAQNDADRARNLVEHARQVRTHVKSLGEKAYWERLTCSPEFVVAFLPLESLFSAALESDPTLLDYAAERRVVIASPITLITLLLTVAHGWRERSTAENLEKIRATGQELYGRLLTMSQHFSRLGDAIEKTVSAYNQTVGSLERNVLPSARKFRELRPANAEQINEPEPLDAAPRALDSSKWKVLEPAKPA
jgi:DNA recombination protein RmuC